MNYLKGDILHKIFRLSLLIASVISFYIFVKTLIFNEEKHKKIYTTWQFPMLLAIFIDTIYYD
jgi:hypothetical protein